MTHFEAVKEFMITMGQEVLTTPKLPTLKLAELRYALIAEEVEELTVALKNDDHVEIADALADILYVGYGAYAAFGIEPGELEFHDGPWDLVPVELPTAGEAMTTINTMNQHLELFKHGYSHDRIDLICKGIDNIIDHAYLLAFEMGIDLYSCFNEVHSSNMSKACKTYADAQISLQFRQNAEATAANYADAQVVQSGNYFVLRKANGKILKGMDYFEPDLRQYMQF